MVWFLSFTVPRKFVKEFSNIKIEECCALSSYYFLDSKQKQSCRIEYFFIKKPIESEIVLRIALLSRIYKLKEPQYELSSLSDINWSVFNEASFVPFSIGRIYIYSAKPLKKAINSNLPVFVRSTIAFGTGYHPSTKGCIMALEKLSTRRLFFRKMLSHNRFAALDVGCGTGILSFVISRFWPVKVLASDVDSKAVLVSKSFSRENGLHSRISVLCADGVKHRKIMENGKFLLVVSNILARPLSSFATSLGKVIPYGGRLILSGITENQVSWIINSYRKQRFVLEEKFICDSWVTLIMKK